MLVLMGVGLTYGPTYGLANSVIHQSGGSLATGHSPYRSKNGHILSMEERPLGAIASGGLSAAGLVNSSVIGPTYRLTYGLTYRLTCGFNYGLTYRIGFGLGFLWWVGRFMLVLMGGVLTTYGPTYGVTYKPTSRLTYGLTYVTVLTSII